MYMTEYVLSMVHVAVVAPGVSIWHRRPAGSRPGLQSLFSATAPATLRMHG